MQIKSIIIAFLCAMSSGALHAEYDAADLKKLFTDKKQRAQIDAVRSGNYSEAGSQKTNQVKVSGYVTRSDGKSVVWLNNKSTLDSSRLGDVKIRQSTVGKNKKVTITIDGKTNRLKPGETWLKETGQIVENY
jgi:hypothetical protein